MLISLIGLFGVASFRERDLDRKHEITMQRNELDIRLMQLQLLQHESGNMTNLTWALGKEFAEVIRAFAGEGLHSLRRGR